MLSFFFLFALFIFIFIVFNEKCIICFLQIGYSRNRQWEKVEEITTAACDLCKKRVTPGRCSVSSVLSFVPSFHYSLQGSNLRSGKMTRLCEKNMCTYWLLVSLD